MRIPDFPFSLTDWSQIPATEQNGAKGQTFSRTQKFGATRVRMVEFSPNYLADHWCVKGHIILCLEGEMTIGLKDGREFLMKPGTSFQIADDAEPHISRTDIGAKLFIVD
ncbi:MAG: DHCW motif cupin fold protein [Nitrospinae bacterium]|nr:DHCW motif cupin fold protein [Nitrospinota bacterium]